MGEFLGSTIVQRALLACVIVGFLSSFYGTFVVQRRLSFLGSGLGHAAFGGIALGLLLQTEPLWIALPFTICVALAIDWIRARTPLSGDTAIGILFAVSVALGTVFLSMRGSTTSDAFGYLFGSILFVQPSDLWVASGLAVLTLGSPRMWKRWAYASFDRELAIADRIPVQRDDTVLAILLAVTVVLSIKIVGILLVAAFLVIPAAAARLVSATFATMTWVSVAFGIGSAVAGLGASYVLDLPSGATIILVQAALFIIALAARRS